MKPTNCPDCNLTVFGFKCSCGWEREKPQEAVHVDHFCSWVTRGLQCQMLGTMSAHVNYHPDSKNNPIKFYCLWHFDCLEDNERAVDQKRFVREYPWKNLGAVTDNWNNVLGIGLGQRKMSQIQFTEPEFDANDHDQMRGLAIVKSMTPTLYAKIIGRFPALGPVVDSFGHVSISVRGMDETLGIKTEKREELPILDRATDLPEFTEEDLQAAPTPFESAAEAFEDLI